ncbi:distal tail protein Dit [Garciella nitratireducens]|uniref:Putative phage tail component, N-terminal domain-containing protein n=1 Tax=Garciella nitratireducens DSM 15102 TaxID=1121911 RepID=A0A1T4K606_9FIRM|nr:distal tail protein Dit [Garciella nitratireducens]SJZ37842.1 putative phage tail component, N-terminal domain-containing protein [Garciella nitratireducens DSM 15102]
MEEPQMYYDIYNESSIMTKFNGAILEEKIPGFRTLNVFGRETIGRENIIQKIEGREGVLYIGNSLPSRVIRVEYWLKADTAQELMHKFELLNYYLKGEQNKIVFTDDPDYYWIGTLDNMDEIEDATNWVVSKFTILCPDPYKYSNELKQLVGVDNLEFGYLNMYPILPEEIKLTMNKDGDIINFKNTTRAKNIILNSNFTIGQEILINPSEQEITLNGQNILNTLDLTSNLEDFYLEFGDILTSTLSCDIQITFRDRRR